MHTYVRCVQIDIMGIQYKQWNNEKMKSITYLHEALKGKGVDLILLSKKTFLTTIAKLMSGPNINHRLVRHADYPLYLLKSSI